MLDALTKHLFLGTRKGEVPMEEPPGCLSGLFRDTDALSATPEEKLLHRCSLGTLFNAAAYKAGPFPGQIPAPADDDHRPPATDRARRILGDALAQSWTPVVHEWIGLAGRCGVRPPFEHIPALLDLAKADSLLCPPILDVCGLRARWLSRFKSDWKALFAPGSGDETELRQLWEEGTLPQRCDAITSLRKTHPEKARDLVKDALPSENAGTRNTIIALFRTGLGHDDEAFLESLLDSDRSLEVRRTVANLLSRIPASALGLRMKKRLSGCVSLTRGFLKRTLHIAPPDEADDTMNRDSIVDKAVAGMGKQAAMLKRMVALTPLSWWKEAFSMAPDAILPLIRKTDWEQALILGLCDAAMAQQNGDWLIALMAIEDSKNVSIDRHSLMQALTPEEREAVIMKTLSVNGVHRISTLLDDSQARHTPLTPETSVKILKTVQLAITYRQSDYHLRDMLKRLGFYLHPDTLAKARTGWPENNPHWPYYSDQAFDLLHIIQSRIDLYKELS